MCKMTYIQGFCFSIFILLKKLKKPPCPSTGEGLYTLWYIPTTDYHAAIKIKQGSLLGTLIEKSVTYIMKG